MTQNKIVGRNVDWSYQGVLEAEHQEIMCFPQKLKRYRGTAAMTQNVQKTKILKKITPRGDGLLSAKKGICNICSAAHAAPTYHR